MITACLNVSLTKVITTKRIAVKIIVAILFVVILR